HGLADGFREIDLADADPAKPSGRVAFELPHSAVDFHVDDDVGIHPFHFGQCSGESRRLRYIELSRGGMVRPQRSRAEHCEPDQSAINSMFQEGSPSNAFSVSQAIMIRGAV